MTSGKVSVIIPVYNVEKHLDRCIKSVVNQTYTDLEIILVEDGSPDKCPEKCDGWAKRDNRIKVIHKENEGLGFARNTGIDNSTGEYICFVDSDDYIEATAVEECFSAIMRENADVVFFGNDKVTLDGKIIERRIPTPPKLVFSGEEIVEQLLPMVFSQNIKTGENWNLSLSACFMMFSSKTIKELNWRFVSEREIISEDFYSVLKLLRYINKAVIIDKVFYHYTTNPESLTQAYRKDRYERILHFYRKMQELSIDLGCSEILDDGITSTFLGLTIGALKQIIASSGDFKPRYSNLKAVIMDSTFQNALHSHSFSGEVLQKRLLYFLGKKKMVLLCYLIVFLRNLKD
ncbi:MAG: glycosyltransferase family 2 protein [Oscillospiraceae bacterium]|nr:glycosyltransferase family 2 protein [Oscillospiraceae bacterium]